MNNTSFFKVFTTVPSAGNPAFCIRSEHTDEDRLRATGRELSGTLGVLVGPSTQADATLRFFAAQGELDFCGHGILAGTLAVFRELGRRELRIETKAGIVETQVLADGLVQFVTKGTFEKRELPTPLADILTILGLAESSLDETLPLCVASIGSPKLFVPLETRAQLMALRPDLKLLADWSRKTGVNGLYAYTRDCVYAASSAHARAFNPLFGVDEDAATGVAAGALSALLAEQQTGPSEYVIEQGYALGRESEIFVRVSAETIRVGGHVVEIDGSVALDQLRGGEIR